MRLMRHCLATQVPVLPTHFPLSATMPSTFLILSFVFGLLTRADYSAAQGTTHNPTRSREDSIAVTRTASSFHAALKSGDTATVRRLISSDLRVLEAGEVENRSQYLSHHLAADIEFAKAVRGERTVVSYAQEGNVAWLVATSSASGKFRGRPINSVGAELMILSRIQKGWQIRAIHWSSAKRQ